MFINTLFENINNGFSLIFIKKINLNYTWEHYHFNILVNPISTDKEPEDKHKNKIKEVDQQINHLKNMQETNISLILWVKALQFLSFSLTICNIF